MKASGTIGLTNMKLKMKDMPDVEIKNLSSPSPRNISSWAKRRSTSERTISQPTAVWKLYRLRIERYYAERKPEYPFQLFQSERFHGQLLRMKRQHHRNCVYRLHGRLPGWYGSSRNIDFQMDANLKQVFSTRWHSTIWTVNLLVKDGKVDENLSMNTMGGNVVMNGYYSTANKEAGNESRIQTVGYRFRTGLQRTGYGSADGSYLWKPERKLSGSINMLTDLDATMSPVLKRCKETAAFHPRS